MNGELFRTLAGRGEAETRVRGSTFLAVAAPATTEEEARAVLAEREQACFDASHHVHAWTLRSGARRASDAGEPSGSSGPPVLAAIDGADLLDCVVVVTRYYGGTKLGVGGLVRAYGGAAALALAAAPVRVGIPARRLRIRYGYEHTSVVMRALEQADGARVEHGYAEGGTVGEVLFSVPLPAETSMHDFLRDHSSGEIVAEPVGEEVLFRTEERRPT